MQLSELEPDFVTVDSGAEPSRPTGPEGLGQPELFIGDRALDDPHQ